MATREETMSKAHLEESSNMAREYFKEKGLTFSDISLENCAKLRYFINKICYELLEDDSYSMIKELEVNRRIKKDKYGIYLTMCGSYFSEREAVSFWNPESNNIEIEVGFCGWASGCNRVPIIQGFIKWCDWMKNNDVKSEKNDE